MKRLIAIFVFTILIPWLLHAQGVGIYTASRQTGITFNSIDATGTAVTAWRAGENTGNNRSYPVPIGFDFNYLGRIYTQISVSTNGFVDLSSNTSAGYQDKPYGFDNSAFSIPAPEGTLLAFAPYYDDLMITWGFTLGNAVKYETTGSPGSRIFTLEWVHFSYQDLNGDQVQFQIRLYEANASVEFIYGNMNVTSATPSYTCGINDSLMSVPPTAAQLFTQQTANSATFGPTPKNNLSVVPASNSKILLTGCILPGAAGTITGPTAVCQSSTGLVYSVPVITGATTYTWTLPAGFTIVSGNNTNAITVNVGETASPGNITVSGSNSCGIGPSASLAVSINPRPAPTIAGPLINCAGASGKVYYTQAGMTNYTWSITPGGTITSGLGTNAITVTWNTPGTDTIKVNYTNTAGCTALNPASLVVTVLINPQPTLSGPASVCAGATGNVYTTQSGMSNYVWTVSAGGTITAGGTPTNNTVTVKWNTAGSQSVSVKFTNSSGCTSQTPTVYPVTVNPIPVPTLSGPSTSCINSTSNVYTTQAGMSSYVWNVSSGGTITAGGTPTSNSVTVTWNTLGAATVSVGYTSPAGCIAAAPAVSNITVNTRPVPTITGPATACAGSVNSTYTTQAGMSGYTWTVTGGNFAAGGTATSSTATVAWTSPGAQNVSVNYNNAFGCPALNPASMAVNINPQPVPSLTGPALLCAGTTGNVYSTDPGMTGYAWTVSPGGTITAGGTSASNTVTVKWNTGGSQYVKVNYNNSFGCPGGIPTTLNVTVHPRPVPTISGPVTACAGTSGHIYTTEPWMTLYIWAVSAGGTINSGGGSDTISVTWNTAGMRTVSLSYTDPYGCTTATPTLYNVTVASAPVPTISGPSSACVGTTGHVYSTEAGMANYLWTVSAGGTITSGTTSSTVTVSWNSTGPQQVSVAYTNQQGCASVNPALKAVTVNLPPVPSVTGNATPCQGSGTVPYSTEPGMTNYTWTVSPGGMISSGSGTNQVMVTWLGTGSQWIAVNYNAGGCTAATPTMLPVTVKSPPGTPGAISGQDSVCNGSSGIPYSVDSVANATSYLWNLPPGATIATGNGTRNITVNFSASAVPGNISVLGSNSCGGGPPSPALFVNVSQKPAAAGVITGLDSVAYGATGIVYQVAAIPFATGYQWSFLAGASIVAGANTNQVTVNFSGSAVSGNIKVHGTNTCGNGTSSPMFTLTITAPPARPVITQSFDYLISSHAFGNQWYKDGVPIAGATGQIYQTLSDGWYWTRVTRYGMVTDTSNHIYVVVTGTGRPSEATLVIFPVPNAGKFRLTGTWTSGEVPELLLISQSGAVVFKSELTPVNGHLDEVIAAENLPGGVYSCILRSKTVQLVRKMVVIH